MEDKRALNVLFHSHVNPYGLFPLDLSKRLGITLDTLEIETDKHNSKNQAADAKQQQEEEEGLV